ncbi:MAG: family 43 glycosylhydrolase [Lachnospiraceae bacterium]|nr:family 43 glycosylhydrolase [Lachnospiraceae bacterium]
MAYLLTYTRQPLDGMIYGPRLAYSMHLAVSRDGKAFQALNHNSGVLFAKATENEDGSLNPKSLKSPWLFALPEGRFAVAAVRIGGDGDDDEESRGCVLLFTSKDLLEYEEAGLLKLGTEFIEQIACGYEQESGSIRLVWRERTGECFTARIREPEDLQLACVPEVMEPDRAWEVFTGGLLKDLSDAGIQGAVPHNIVEIAEAGEEGFCGKIPAKTADRLCKKLLTPVNVGIRFPEQIQVSEPEQLGQYMAEALYSDGTSARKCVDWDLSRVDFQKKGSFSIRGRVRQEHFAFPVACNRADPCIGRWKGKYYFIATNDADDNHTLYIRESDTISGLTEAEEHLLLDSDTYPGIGGLLWAPEFHEIHGRLYIFHAATPGEFFCEESHVMELREGGNPVCREDWSAPRRVVKRDGSDICEAGKEITLDMTCFEWQGEWYAVWSQRQFLPKDLGAWLYIAKLDPREPWRLLTDPIVLSKPEYGWANNHTFVDEGPFALMGEDKLYLTFSSAAVDASYVVGLLTVQKGMDLLDAGSWKKKNYPILTSRSVEGEFGTGHNAYVTDDNGTVWNTYHARPGVDGARSSGIRRVHFDIDGDPVLDLTEGLDLKEEYRTVETTLIVG